MRLSPHDEKKILDFERRISKAYGKVEEVITRERTIDFQHSYPPSKYITIRTKSMRPAMRVRSEVVDTDEDVADEASPTNVQDDTPIRSILSTSAKAISKVFDPTIERADAEGEQIINPHYLEWEAECKRVGQRRQEHELQEQRFCFILDSNIDPNMRRKLAPSRIYQEHLAANRLLDMWVELRKVASAGAILDKGIVRDRFELLKQGKMNFEQYCSEFESRLDAANRVKVRAEGYAEEEIRDYFVRGLDEKKYGGELERMRMDRHLGRGYPANFEQIKRALRVANETVLRHVLDQDPVKPGKKEFGNAARAVARPSNKKFEPKKSSSKDGPRPPQTKAEGGGDKGEYRFDIVCHRCGGVGHIKAQCSSPDGVVSKKPSARKAVVDKPKGKKSERAHVAAVDNDEDEETESAGAIVVGSATECAVGNLKLDSGATNHIIRDVGLLTNLREIEPIKVCGLTGSDHCRVIGDLKSFGWAYHMPESNLNLLSLGRLIKDSFKVEFHDKENCFLIKKPGDHIMKFSSDSSGLYRYQADEVERETAMAVDHISEEQRRRAREARELQARLCYPGDGAFKELIKNGGIIGCRLTWKDVEVATKIFGPSHESYQGKATAPEASRHPASRVTTIGMRLHCDLMFYRGVGTERCYLVSVDDATGYVMVITLRAKGIASLENGFAIITGWYKHYGHEVKEIVTDSEANFVGLSAVMIKKGINMVQRAPEVHSKIAERAVRTVKERVRCVLAGLNYQLPINLYDQLTHYVAQSINLVPNELTNSVSVREIVTGTKVDVKKDLAMKFGDVGLFRVPRGNLPKDTDPRAEYGIMVGRYFGSKGSMAVFIPSRGVIVRRVKFIASPLTKEAMEHLLRNGNPRVEIPQDVTIDKGLEAQEIPAVVAGVAVGEEVVGPCDPSTVEWASGANISVKEALEGGNREACRAAIVTELNNMLKYRVWKPVKGHVDGKIIYSKMFLKQKFDSAGRFEKIKARLVVGGNL